MPNPVTDAQVFGEILKQMEEGTPPWQQPWSGPKYSVVIGSMPYSSNMWPSNVRAPKVPFGLYNGILLNARARSRNYRTNFWIPEEVVSKLGVEILAKDNVPTEILRFSAIGSVLGRRRVFNIDQVKYRARTLGVSLVINQESNPRKSYKKSEYLLDKLKTERNLKVRYDTQAAYYPSHDIVIMPPEHHFDILEPSSGTPTDGTAHYWATMWHEVIHWTGHDTRLNRDRSRIFGDQEYAFEELVAELGSAFLCSYLGIEGQLQHAGYLDSWHQALKQERKDGRTMSTSSLFAAAELAADAKRWLLKSSEDLGIFERPGLW